MPQAPAIAERTSSTHKVLYRFRSGSPYGYHPAAPLVDVNGTLYGTTMSGGNTTGHGCYSSGSSDGCGTVYSISPSGVEHVLYAFTGGSDGAFPQAGLTDVNGTLYGMTPEGFYSGCGIVYSISTSGTENVLYHFTLGDDGCNPQGNLIYANGLLYGTTYSGGSCKLSSFGCGTVFSISTSGKETVLYRFAGGADDGANPASGLTEVKGTFYGTTVVGGGGRYSNYCSCGTVYSISKSGKEKMVYRFGEGAGVYPQASLVDLDGTMYGTNERGDMAATDSLQHHSAGRSEASPQLRVARWAFGFDRG